MPPDVLDALESIVSIFCSAVRALFHRTSDVLRILDESLVPSL